MGRFVNPDNSAFQVALDSEIYVDKTGLLNYTNRVLGTNNALICNSRPRRFGKSVTANMLAAYYSRGCDSERLFSGLCISESETFRTHLNQYDVIRLDIQWCYTSAKSAGKTVAYIEENVIAELRERFGGMVPDEVKSLADALSYIHKESGNKFIIIIDEWDALIRDEAEDIQVQEEYINFLRGLFKGAHPTEFLLLAYLTGILPIKKLKTQSALNNFEQFTMLSPGGLAPYIGFTEDEVKTLCEKYGRNFDEVKRWYDGYLLEWMPPAEERTDGAAGPIKLHVYNPMAVEGVMRRGVFESYWSATSSYDSIAYLISNDFDGLRKSILEMLAGGAVKLKTTSYQNDMTSFRNKDDVLTALVHLGYLAFDRSRKSAFIPNEEIRSEFSDAVAERKWNEFLVLQKKSEELLYATIHLDEEKVARLIEDIHLEYVSVLQYNDENALSYVLTLAYLSAMQYYFKPVREFPSGRGFADVVFIPKTEYAEEMPALLIELKWNKSADAAIRQIREKKYTKALENYKGDLLLVSVNYHQKRAKHQCRIEKFAL